MLLIGKMIVLGILIQQVCNSILQGLKLPLDLTNLPAVATSTVYVEGVPLDATRREAAHIFRRFPGYLSNRIFRRQSKLFQGTDYNICFAEFKTKEEAAHCINELNVCPKRNLKFTHIVQRVTFLICEKNQIRPLISSNYRLPVSASPSDHRIRHQNIIPCRVSITMIAVNVRATTRMTKKIAEIPNVRDITSNIIVLLVYT